MKKSKFIVFALTTILCLSGISVFAMEANKESTTPFMEAIALDLSNAQSVDHGYMEDGTEYYAYTLENGSKLDEVIENIDEIYKAAGSGYTEDGEYYEVIEMINPITIPSESVDETIQPNAVIDKYSLDNYVVKYLQKPVSYTPPATHNYTGFPNPNQGNLVQYKGTLDLYSYSMISNGSGSYTCHAYYRGFVYGTIN